MKNYLLMMICMVMVQQLRSQEITVVNKTDLQPIPAVRIYNKGGKQVITDSKGRANLTELKGADSIFFSHLSYQPHIELMTGLAGGNIEIRLTEKTYSMDELVISASRFEEKKRDVAQPIEVISSKTIEFANQQTAADLMQNTGNVFVQRSQMGGGSPVIRGFEANKVLIVVDGVRMNNAIYRGGHLQNVITLDNNAMDRVEVVYGPGSVVYGSDALGGVMHFHTKTPVFSTGDKSVVKSDAFLRFASANTEKTGHLGFNLGGKKLASSTALTFSNYGDLRQGGSREPAYPDFGKRPFYVETVNGIDSSVVNNDQNVQVGTGYSQLDVLEKLEYRPNERIIHGLNLQLSTSSDIPRYDRLTQTEGSDPRYAEWFYGAQRRFLAAYSFRNVDSSKLYDVVQLVTAYQNIAESRHDRRFRNHQLNHRNEELNIGTLNLDFEKKLGKSELRYGVEGTYDDVKSTASVENITDGSEMPLDTRYPDGGSQMYSLAAFVTHAWEISPKLILNDGLRYSYVGLNADFIATSFYSFPFTSADQKNSALNGSLGIVYMPGADWRFTLLGSSGFRAPNVDDLSKVFESTSGYVVVPNPNLKPEYTYNLDAGISKAIDKTISVGISGYYTWYLDAITTRPSTFNGQDSIEYDGQLSAVAMNVNAAEAYIYGANGFLNAQVTENFSIYSTLNYTYVRIKADTGDVPLDHIPPVFGKTGMILQINKFRAEFFTIYQGWKKKADYNLNGEDNFNGATSDGMPAWYTLNLRTAYQLNKTVQIQIAVENILDRNYRVFASGVSAPGRNLIVALRASF